MSEVTKATNRNDYIGRGEYAGGAYLRDGREGIVVEIERLESGKNGNVLIERMDLIVL